MHWGNENTGGPGMRGDSRLPGSNQPAACVNYRRNDVVDVPRNYPRGDRRDFFLIFGDNVLQDLGKSGGANDAGDSLANCRLSFWRNMGTYIAAQFGMSRFGMRSWKNISADRGDGLGAIFGRDIFTNDGGDIRNANLRMANFWPAKRRTSKDGRKRIAAENMRRNSWTQLGLNRKTNFGTLGKNGRGERGSSDREMERFGRLRFQRLQLFLLAIAASDFAERGSVWLRIGVETCRRILRRRGRAIIFLRASLLAGFDSGKICRGENVRALEIVIGVNMPRMFLYFLFVGALLPRGIGNTPVL